MADIKVNYDGVEITYLEKDDKWTFTLRGRERSAESLAKAKEAIDKPAPEAKKAFERIPAIKVNYSGIVKRGEITSIAESRAYSNRKEVWFTNGEGRRKEDASEMYSVTPENDRLIAEHAERKSQIANLEELNKKTLYKLTKIDFSVFE